MKNDMNNSGYRIKSLRFEKIYFDAIRKAESEQTVEERDANWKAQAWSGDYANKNAKEDPPEIHTNPNTGKTRTIYRFK